MRRTPPARPHRQVQPRVQLDLSWPWVYRYQRNWTPRYRYRQIVYIDAGWRSGHRESRLDLRTYYRHRVRSASARRAEIDVYLERIEIFENGRFVGEVSHIPSYLAKTRASVDRNGYVRFDRDLFLIGDLYAGFELISTRHYDGFVLKHYRRAHGLRVGFLDLRRERVVGVRRSRLFDPVRFAGFVPINLLPDDAGWMIDYGIDSYSGHYWGDDDRFYYGFQEGDGYSSNDVFPSTYDRVQPRGATSGRQTSDAGTDAAWNGPADRQQDGGRSATERQPLERSDDRRFETENGVQVRITREATIERVE